MRANDTRNQHFVTQVEQRLNAINPKVHPSKMRIYSFAVVDREKYVLPREFAKDRPIRTNLSFLDLFSFDVLDEKGRLNFESLFQDYEGHIETHTRSLLAKLNSGDGDIKTEIIDLFAAKLLNFIRNPFCIEKMLNTFPGIASYEPTDPALLADYQRIVSGRKPHQAHLCAQLGISDLQYRKWLAAIFMLLVPMADGRPNFFDDTIKGMLEDRKTHIAAHVYEYDTHRCLLSDRGFCELIRNDKRNSFTFNLCSNAFFNYSFSDNAKVLVGKASPEYVAYALAKNESRPTKQISVNFERNNLDMLARYNRRVVEQCHERVFCSVREGIVLWEPRFTASA